MTHTKESIKALLERSDKAVARGVVAIYHFQTDREQALEETTHQNGVGFNSADAPFLTSIACWYLKRDYLTTKQTYRARKQLLKYSGQLAKIANANADKPEAPGKCSEAPREDGIRVTSRFQGRDVEVVL